MATQDVIVHGVFSPRRCRQGLPKRGGPPITPNPDHPQRVLIIRGPEETDGTRKPIEGTLVSARISLLTKNKNAKTTIVHFGLDDRMLLNIDPAKMLKYGLITQNTPYGVIVYEGKGAPQGQHLLSISIGFSIPLYFHESLEVDVDVRKEGLQKIEAIVIWGSRHRREDQPMPDDDDGTEFP